MNASIATLTLDGSSLHLVVGRRRKPCALCGGTNIASPPWDKHEWACRPCWNGYVNFRRAFKLEHGRFPTFEEVMADGDEPPNEKLSESARENP
jgi:hypothetical protein